MPALNAEILHLPGAVCRTVDIAGFSRIRQESTGLVLLERTLPASLAQWLETLDLTAMEDIAAVFDVETLHKTLPDALKEADLPPGPGRAALAADIVELATHYCAEAGNPLLHIRLEAISGDACWKFHRDFVRLRLVTTYRGPGTEWERMPHAHDALTSQKSYKGPIETFPPYAAGLFKGSLGPGEQGVVHRSPPIAGTDQTRLFLCLNEPPAAF